MVGSESGGAGGLGERQRVLTERLPGAHKLDGGDIPQSSRVGVAVCAEGFRALAPDGGQVARYGFHT